MLRMPRWRSPPAPPTRSACPAWQRARPVLEALCRRVEEMGPPAAAARMKLAINLLPYLLTNRHFRPPAVLRSRVDPQVLQVLWQVQEGFLRTALQAVDDTPGGLEGYLAQRLRLTPVARQRLHDRYLLA